MWQKLSLRARLNTLLALLLTLGLAVNIARLVLEAGPRVQAEDQSVIRLARAFVGILVESLNETPDPDARLSRIIADLNQLTTGTVGWKLLHIEFGRFLQIGDGLFDARTLTDRAHFGALRYIQILFLMQNRGECSNFYTWQAGIAHCHFASKR